MSKHNLCERCAKKNEIVVAKIAHHRVWLTKDNIGDPAITLAWDNLEALCQDCHNREHHRSKKQQRYSFDKGGQVIPHITPSLKQNQGGRDTEGGH